MTINMPKELPAEQSIIAGMMQSKTYLWSALSKLKDYHFYSTVFKKCFEVMRDSKSADFPMLEKACSCSEFNALDLFDTNHSTTGKTEFDLVIAAYQAREGIETCYAAINALSSEDRFEATTTISNTVKRLSEANSVHCSDVKVIGDLVGEEFNRLERITNGEQSCFIKTGIEDIDKLLCIEREEYIPLGARPSNCKSMLASQICRNICKEDKVALYFCLDSSRASEVSRAVFAESGVSLLQFNRGFNCKRDFNKIKTGAGIVKRMGFYLDGTRKITTEMIYAQCQRVKAIAGRLDLVVVDFLQNVKAPIKDIRERVSYVSEELHHLPSEIHCPVMPLSQLSRYKDEESQAPTMKNLKESGDIEEDADKILMLWYPEKYPCNRPRDDKDTSKDQFKNLLNLYVEKNKNGTTGHIPLNVDAATFTITDRIVEPNF